VAYYNYEKPKITMNIAILGFDIEGKASYDYFSRSGEHRITICDQNPDAETPSGVEAILGESYLDNLDRFDLLVRTAGLPPAKILSKNPSVAGKITTQVNEFFKASPTSNIIGVTGTKGKGTTSTLIYRMLMANGSDVYLGGNIGVPVLPLLDTLKTDSWVVIELSSFQLIDLQASPHIAVCLMVVPEHLNWHANMEEYIAAKSQLFAKQTPQDIAIYCANNDFSKQIAGSGQAQTVPYYDSPGAIVQNDSIVIDNQTICALSEIKLLGEHNWQNVCAAVTTVWQVSQNVEAIKSVITSFSGLEHRLEFVREFNGVKYYDDSFGTTPETAIVAMKAFSEPKVIILGGSDKGANYDELAKSVSENKVRKVLLIGDEASKIQNALEVVGFNNFIPGGTDMKDIVDTARSSSEPGDIILLSTACASFGLFKDYKDRGNQFKQAVQELA